MVLGAMAIAVAVGAVNVAAGKPTTAAEDEVKSLPGWDKALPSKHYSGYITVGAKKNHHMHCEWHTN